MTATTHPAAPDPDELVADTFETNPRGQQLLELLRADVSLPRIIEIGRYRRSWTPTEVAWAKRYYIDTAPSSPDQWLPTGYDPQPTARPARAHITHRTAQALDGLCRGLTPAEIAAEAGLAVCTVDQYVRAAIRAVGATSREEAARLARSGQVRLFLVERRGGRPSRGQRAVS